MDQIDQQPTAQPQQSDVNRADPNPDPARAALVKDWCDKIAEAKEFWSKRFARMRRSAKFVAGQQWVAVAEGTAALDLVKDDRYVANITLRHINQRVASIYAKNPKVVARPRPKMHFVAWDGTPEMLMAARNTALAQAGVPPPPVVAPGQQPPQPQKPGAAAVAGAMQPPAQPAPMLDPETAKAVMQDYNDGRAMKALYAKMGRSLELVAQYSLDEPMPKFKTQAKQLVRRVLSTGIGYAKLGYQRIKKATPDVDAKIKDATDRLSHLETLMADLLDDKLDEASKEKAELELNLAALQKQQNIVLREGLIFAFPKSWGLIVDPAVTQMKGFVGAHWLAEEYLFTKRQVQALFKVDVGSNYTAFNASGEKGDKRKKDQDLCAVYEVYDLDGQVRFFLCQGYKDFLQAPDEPDVFLEQFHPYFALTFNDVEDAEGEKGSVIPPGDAELLEPMQVEYNRSREGLRVHRQANRPAYLARKGMFGDNTKTALGSHADHEILEHELPPNTKVSDVIEPKPTVKIDGALPCRASGTRPLTLPPR